MGDINFTIAKDVDLNKVVNLDIDKNVNVEVNNDDILATAEADAEAFGERALAETDAYTYVRGEGGNGQIVLEPGEIDILGNTLDYLLSNDTTDTSDLIPDTAIANTLTIDFNANPGDPLPDVDDVNGFGKLETLTAPPPDIADAPLPDPVLSIDDFQLELDTGTIGTTPDGNLEAEYELAGDVVIDFGERTLDIQPGEEGDECDNCGELTTAQLTLTIPEGTDFLVEYLGATEPDPLNPPSGPIELEFDAFGDNDGDGEIDPAFFTFDGVNYDVTAFVMTADSLMNSDIADLSDYAFEAIADFPMSEVVNGPGTGEAFSYAESTAALDLNGDDNVIPTPVETEV